MKAEQERVYNITLKEHEVLALVPQILEHTTKIADAGETRIMDETATCFALMLERLVDHRRLNHNIWQWVDK